MWSMGGSKLMCGPASPPPRSLGRQPGNTTYASVASGNLTSVIPQRASRHRSCWGRVRMGPGRGEKDLGVPF
jgi:hypothetical protein